MGDRLLFKVRHKGKCIAWFFHNWMAEDADEFKKEYRAALKKMNIDKPTTPVDAVRALILAGESWFAQEGAYTISTPTGKPDSEAFDKAVLPNVALLAEHPELQGNPELRTNFFVGTGDAYVEYMSGWCENEVTVGR